jgi:hypothetical protein
MAATTALLINWRRPNHVRRIVSSLRAQSVPVEIFLLDNSGSSENFDVDFTLRSNKNLHCWMRWAMAMYANSEFVFSLDDDLEMVDPKTLEKCIGGIHGVVEALGYEGVRLVPKMDYARSHHKRVMSSKDFEVDIIKGRFLFTRKSTVVSVLRGQSASTENGRIEDDILLSSEIQGIKLLPGFLKGSFRELPTGWEALHRQPDHRRSREYARQKYFP